MTRIVLPTSLTRALLVGAGAGVIASLVMAMYAMIAAWEKGTGFFTPLYHIASLWASGDSMMASMEDAAAGTDFHFVLGTAILGALIHITTGAGYGAVFGLIASRLPFGLAVLAVVGLVYGFIVFAVSAYAGLPLAAAVFDSGDPIKNMAEMAGWGTFIIEHLLFGLVLGVLVALGNRKTAAASTEPIAH
ncbi:hypothetical protein [Nocardioides speluncae]|uniref:hypothetical protein n=1 Tax=Nocardioides speluncae TaxID=2670337 RepID=UPI00197E8CA9|nr:hypothetical protein [Nocardioides speluncae]